MRPLAENERLTAAAAADARTAVPVAILAAASKDTANTPANKNHGEALESLFLAS